MPEVSRAARAADLDTPNVAQCFVDAWSYISGQYPDAILAQVGPVAVTLSQTIGDTMLTSVQSVKNAGTEIGQLPAGKRRCHRMFQSQYGDAIEGANRCCHVGFQILSFS